MLGDGKANVPREVKALGVGLPVTVASALITTLVNPLPAVLAVSISVGLGAVATIGTYLILYVPPEIAADRQIKLDYRRKLREIGYIALALSDASRSECLDAGVSQQLTVIARKTNMIHQRYRDRHIEFVGASNFLLVAQRLSRIVQTYVQVKCGELVMDKRERERHVASVETHQLPLIHTALENWLIRIDAGEVQETEISAGTLEDMIKSLGLIKSLSDQLDQPPEDKKDTPEGNKHALEGKGDPQ